MYVTLFFSSLPPFLPLSLLHFLSPSLHPSLPPPSPPLPLSLSPSSLFTGAAYVRPLYQKAIMRREDSCSARTISTQPLLTNVAGALGTSLDPLWSVVTDQSQLLCSNFKFKCPCKCMNVKHFCSYFKPLLSPL